MKQLLGLILVLACATLLPAAGEILTRDAVVDRPGPALTLKDLSGQEVSFESFKGKVVIVDFWATWCEPCKTEIPLYLELQKKYGPQGLVVVGISMDKKKPAAVKKFADEMGMDYTLVIGTVEDLDKFADGEGGNVILPATYLVNRAGRIVHEKQGLMDHAKYEAIVKAAL